MGTFREDFKKACEESRDEFWKMQRHILRPMISINNVIKTPVITSEDIFEIFCTQGAIKIPVEEFLDKYNHMIDDMIELEWEGGEHILHPSMVDYASSKNYDVTFEKGDILVNPFFDPSVRDISIYDYDDDDGNLIGGL